jgi:hypothetical protein
VARKYELKNLRATSKKFAEGHGDGFKDFASKRDENVPN